MFVSVGIFPTTISAAASGLAAHASAQGPRCAGSTSPTAAASTPRRRRTLRATADGQGGTSEPPQRPSGKTPRTKLTSGLSFTSEYLNALESVELPDALPNLSDMMRVDGGRDGCEQCRGTGEIPCPCCEGAGYFTLECLGITSSGQCGFCRGKKTCPCPSCKPQMYKALASR